MSSNNELSTQSTRPYNSRCAHYDTEISLISQLQNLMNAMWSFTKPYDSRTTELAAFRTMREVFPSHYRLGTTRFDGELSAFERGTDWGAVVCFVKVAVMSGANDVEEPTMHLYGVRDICLLEFLHSFLESTNAQAVHVLGNVSELGIRRDVLANAWNGQSSESIVSGVWRSSKDSDGDTTVSVNGHN
jgi:hypothetical protein